MCAAVMITFRSATCTCYEQHCKGTRRAPTRCSCNFEHGSFRRACACTRGTCSCSSMSTRSKVHVAYLRSTVGYMRKHAQCIEVEVEEGCSLEVLHASLVRLCASENSRTCTNIVLHGESRVSPATPRNTQEPKQQHDHSAT